MTGIGVIHNPFSKKNRKKPETDHVLQGILGSHGIFKKTASIDELSAVAIEFLENDIEIVAVNGGDGTFHHVITAFVNAYEGNRLPKFILLRGGTMNTVSNSLKFKGRTVDIFKNAVKSHNAGKTFREIQQPLLKINKKYGFISGLGVVAKFLDAYYSSESPGPRHAAKMVLKLIFSSVFGTQYAKNMFSLSEFQITVDGEKLGKDRFMFALGCTIKEIGLGFTPTPHAYDSPGHFHFIAGSMQPVALVPMVPALWLGRDINHPKIHSNQIAKEVVIESKGSIRWTIDGEMYETKEPLHFSVGPEITIVAP